MLVEAGVVGERRGEDGLARDEADDDLGERVKAVQYALAARLSTWRRRAVACAARSSARSTSSTVSLCAWRKCAIGALESTTTWRPPGRLTTASGRTVVPCRLTLVTCSSKSQRASRPDSSSTRRSWTSPQAPRTVEALRAVARVAVSERSDSVDRLTSVRRSPSWPNCSERSRSSAPTCRSTRPMVSRRGASRLAVVSSTSRAPSRSATRSRRTSRSASAPAERASSVERADSHASRPPTSAPMTSPTSRAVRSMRAPSQRPPTRGGRDTRWRGTGPVLPTWRTAYARGAASVGEVC